jgi:hypothetical protein
MPPQPYENDEEPLTKTSHPAKADTSARAVPSETKNLPGIKKCRPFHFRTFFTFGQDDFVLEVTWDTYWGATVNVLRSGTACLCPLSLAGAQIIRANSPTHKPGLLWGRILGFF